MPRLSSRARDNLKSSQFAGPGRSFPIPDKAHARLAIGAATRSERAGNISKATAQRIQSRARAKLNNRSSRKGSSR